MIHSTSSRFRLLCHKMFYESNTRLFVIVNDLLSIVIIVSILSVALESVPELSEYHSIFWMIECLAVLVFTIEYVCRIIGSPKKWAYIFSFFGLIDLVSILPTFMQIANLSPLKSTRALRILRFLRIIRLAKVARLDHLPRPSREDTLGIIRLNLKIYFSAIVFSVVILGNLAYIFEQNYPYFENIFLSMLWVLESLLGGSISRVVPSTYLGIIVFMIARFLSFVLLGFLIHIIGNIVSHFLLGKKFNKSSKV